LSCLFGSNFARIMLWGCGWFLHYIPQLRCLQMDNMTGNISFQHAKSKAASAGGSQRCGPSCWSLFEECKFSFWLFSSIFEAFSLNG
jgi:hypothetical protein